MGVRRVGITKIPVKLGALFLYMLNAKKKCLYITEISPAGQDVWIITIRRMAPVMQGPVTGNVRQNQRGNTSWMMTTPVTKVAQKQMAGSVNNLIHLKTSE